MSELSRSSTRCNEGAAPVLGADAQDLVTFYCRKDQNQWGDHGTQTSYSAGHAPKSCEDAAEGGTGPVENEGSPTKPLEPALTVSFS